MQLPLDKSDLLFNVPRVVTNKGGRGGVTRSLRIKQVNSDKIVYSVNMMFRCYISKTVHNILWIHNHMQVSYKGNGSESNIPWGGSLYMVLFYGFVLLFRKLNVIYTNTAYLWSCLDKSQRI